MSNTKEKNENTDASEFVEIGDENGVLYDAHVPASSPKISYDEDTLGTQNFINAYVNYKPSLLPEVGEVDKSTSKNALQNISCWSSIKNAFQSLSLPVSLCERFCSQRRIMRLHYWQSECLSQVIGKGSRSLSADLVYTSPTSGGKTLVAELLLLHTIFVKPNGFLLFILPYVALAEEKARALTDLLDEEHGSDVIVECCVGKKNIRRIFCLKRPERSIIVLCTVEKANQIVNESIRRESANEIRLIIADEIHLMDDNTRGHLLEMLLTKMLFWRSQKHLASDDEDNPSLNFILMSASVIHSKTLYRWLESVNKSCSHETHFYQTDYRPVPLDSYIVTDGTVFSPDGKKVRSLFSNSQKGSKDYFQSNIFSIDPNGIEHDEWQNKMHSDAIHDMSMLVLAEETVTSNNQILFFCATKNLCEHTAHLIGTHVSRICLPKPDLLKRFSTFMKEKFQVPYSHAFRNRKLSRALKFGTAFHHSGLSVEERSAIEYLFRSGEIKLICCTTTLASGVNLPVRRVVFRSPLRVGCDTPLSLIGYKQASGRAGRTGLDKKGESFLLTRNTEERWLAEKLLQSECQSDTLGTKKSSFTPIISTFSFERVGMRAALLEAVEIGIVRSVEDIQAYLENTLLAHTEGYSAAHSGAREVLRELEGSGIIRWSRNTRSFSTSNLGKACVASQMSPVHGMWIHAELSLAMGHFVLSNDVHMLFHIIPSKRWSAESRFREQGNVAGILSADHEIFSLEPRWTHFYSKFYSRLPRESMLAAQAVGIDESFLVQVQNLGIHMKDSNESAQFLALKETHRRFYIALILHDIINEVPPEVLQVRYKLQSAQMHNLMEVSSMLSTKVAVFCQALGWWLFSLAFEQLSKRISGGVHCELLDLMQLPSMTMTSARTLYSKGIVNVTDVHALSVHEIKQILERNAFTTREKLGLFVLKIKKEAESHVESDPLIFSNKCLYGIEEETKYSISSSGLQEATVGDASLAICSEKEHTYKPSGDERINREENDYVEDLISNRISRLTPHHEIQTCGTAPLTERILYRITSINETLHQIRKNQSVSIHLAIEDKVHHCSPKVPKLYVFFVTAHSEAHLCICTTFAQTQAFLDWYQESKQHKFCSCLKQQISTIIQFLKIVKKSTPVPGYPICAPSNIFPSFTNFYLQYPESKTLEIDDCTLTKKLLRISAVCNASTFQSFDKDIPDCVCEQTIDKGFRSALESLERGKLAKNVYQLGNLKSFFCRVETPLSMALAIMERRGIGFDRQKFFQIQKCVGKTRLSLRMAFDSHYLTKNTTQRFSLDRPSDCAKMLYDILKIKPMKSATTRKRRKMTRSTKSTLLEQAIENNGEHAVLLKILMQYRKLKSLDEKFLQPMAKRITYSCQRYHGEFVQNGTSTGRMTMAEPNLQNIPRSFLVTALPHDEVQFDLRSCFTADVGDILLSFDYMQMELRILSSLSNDTRLQLDLQEGTVDYFISLAAELYGKPIGCISTDERRQAKTICYGILYGRGKKSIAAELKWSADRVSTFLHAFKERYPQAIKYVKDIIIACKRTGCVQTLSGRCRAIPTIHSTNEAIHRAAKRSAVNCAIQGGAADIMKLAIVNIHKLFSKWQHENIEKGRDHRGGPFIALHIHDEVLVESPQIYMERVSVAVQRAMEESAVALGASIPVRVSQGKTWADLQR